MTIENEPTPIVFSILYGPIEFDSADDIVWFSKERGSFKNKIGCLLFNCRGGEGETTVSVTGCECHVGGSLKEEFDS